MIAVNTLNDVEGTLLYFIEDKPDIITDSPCNQKLDAGKCAQENNQCGIAGDGGIHNPHHQRIDNQKNA